MKYFLDFGSNIGQGLFLCVNLLNITPDWKIKCYEISSASVSCLKFNLMKFPELSNLDVEVNHQGVWFENCHLDMYVHNPYGTGNNLLGAVVDGNIQTVLSDKVSVKDINEIIDACIAQGATEIYIKMDIEGSEYAVLPRLLQSEHLSKIKTIWIEWHERFFPIEFSEALQQKKQIKEKLKSHNIIVFNDDYMDHEKYQNYEKRFLAFSTDIQNSLK